MRQLILLLSISIFCACENESNDYPITYSFDSFATGEVRIFTRNGEIENIEMSERFISSWSNYFYKQDSFRVDDFDFNGTITLNSNRQAIFYSSDTIMNYVFVQKNGVIYFESSDTSYSNMNLMDMKDSRFQFGPITQTDIKEGLSFGFPPMPGYLYGYHPCVYALNYGKEIRFPLTSFLEKNCIADPSWSISGNCNIGAISNVNNLFNESYLEKFTDNEWINSPYDRRDTVVIQENFIVFRKN